MISTIEPNLAFADYFHDGDIVAASNDISIPIGGVAAKVVSVSIPEPFVADAEQRSLDVSAMIDPLTTPAKRDALIAVYKPGWMVVGNKNVSLLLAQLPGASIVGEVNGYTIVRLPPPEGS